MRKMKRTVQQYTPELRAEAVRLVLDQGMTQGEVAQRLSVPKGTIANWVAAAKHGRGPISGAKTAQELESEIARLRKELADVKQEREILKKAAAYFARNHSEVRVHEAVVQGLCGQRDVPGVGSLAQWLLRLARSRAIGPSSRG